MTEHDANQWLLEAVAPRVPSQYQWHKPNANDLKPEPVRDLQHTLWGAYGLHYQAANHHRVGSAYLVLTLHLVRIQGVRTVGNVAVYREVYVMSRNQREGRYLGPSALVEAGFPNCCEGDIIYVAQEDTCADA